MAANAGEGSLDELLKANGLPDLVAVELAKAPFKITTVTQFANYFETKAEVYSLFLGKVAAMKDEGDVVANLKQCWRTAEACVTRAVKRVADGLPEEDLEDPLRTEIRTGLEDTHRITYKFSLPPMWTCFPSLLGRFHREFTKRSHVC